MLRVDEAIAAVLRRASPLPSRTVGLAESLGLTLDEDVSADIDLPPFDKALMDGYAVRSADLSSPGEHRLTVVDEILAGRLPTRALGPGESARIMTGAPLPPDADAVVMVEKARTPDASTVILPGPVPPGLNRLTRGREMTAGELLLGRGAVIDPTRLGLIASAGRAQVRAIPRPTVAVVATGDELVPIGQRPGPGQIRNTNGVMLEGMVAASGARTSGPFPIAPDDPDRLRDALARALGIGEGTHRPSDWGPGPTDVLIVSGGVSAGTRDLVPSTLVALGVQPVFHKVDLKPGKPLWFGIGPDRGGGPGALVFGLPGNPASGVVGFLLFVRPALEALAGRPPAPTPLVPALLGQPFEHRGDRPTYHPSRLVEGRAFPLDWAGSADLRTVALADGFVAFAAGNRAYREGESIPFLPLRVG